MFGLSVLGIFHFLSWQAILVDDPSRDEANARAHAGIHFLLIFGSSSDGWPDP
jgi:hypothetical protein